MDLETVLSELKQLKEDFAELKNKFESLLGQAGWQWFKYNTAPNTVPPASSGWTTPPINYIACTRCGIFIQVGTLHTCNGAQPANPFSYPTVFNSNGNVAEQNTQAVSHT